MKVLYLLRQDPDDTTKEIIEAQRKANELTVVDLTGERDYLRLMSLIETSDRVISC